MENNWLGYKNIIYICNNFNNTYSINFIKSRKTVVASSQVLMTISVTSILLTLSRNLQISTKVMVGTIFGSFFVVLLIEQNIALNMDYWAEFFSLIALLIAIGISICGNNRNIKEIENDVFEQKDIRDRMSSWSQTDNYAYLTQDEANEVRAFLDKYNI